ncbi:MAG: glycosyltransferase family 2 protein [Candidatus Bathyarchaeia archaeon]
MIVLVIPTLDEEEGIGLTIQEYKKQIRDIEVVVADGGSVDRTREISSYLGADVITVNEKGKGSAIAESIKYLKRKYDPEFVIFTDGDYSYPADKIKEMINLIENDDEIGAVIGDRLTNMSKFKIVTDIYLLGNYLIRWLYNAWWSISLHDPLSGLRVIRWAAISDWCPLSRGFEIETEMNLYLILNGWKIKEVPIDYRKRLGKKKLRIKDGLPIIKLLRHYPNTYENRNNY